MLKSISFNKEPIVKDVKFSPISVLILMSISIIIAHFVVMLIGITNSHSQSLSEILFDSFILIILLFPLLYIFVFRPLITQINQRENAQRELFVNENKFRNLVETMNEGLVVQNNDGLITFVNNRFCELLGLEQNELFGNKLSNFLDEGNNNVIKELSTGHIIDKSESFEISLKSFKNNNLFTIVSPSHIFDENNHIIGTLMVVTDITGRKQMEMDLIEAKNKAHESDKLKSAFLNLISHEIRTPINAIVNFLSLIKEEYHDKFPNDLIQYINPIESGSKRLIRTIELILNMAVELTNGGSKPETEKIIISREILPSIIKEFSCVAESKGLRLNYFIKEEAAVHADKFMAAQIFLHIIDNAIKFTNKGNINVTLFRSNNRQLIEIKDTGIGISKEFQSKMFQLFSQEENGYSRSYEGNGLGLALVKKYCELNNIDILVNSSKGEGSAFTLIFNLKTVLTNN
ncbi:MAG: PAS domain-containing sensor histidine kinase [Bacteroidetes bacterium]|nr:PAS domain-containing sensor histidine kinase [Bacteroidota bacterium]